jgi:hypothetical protein
MLKMKNFGKLFFGTPLKSFLQLRFQKGLAFLKWITNLQVMSMKVMTV